MLGVGTVEVNTQKRVREKRTITVWFILYMDNTNERVMISDFRACAVVGLSKRFLDGVQ